MPNNWRSVLLITLLALGLGKVFLFFTFHPDVDDEVFRESFNNHYGVYALSLPKQVDFSGEKVPLDDPEVYERLDRELLVNTYWQSNSLLLIKRSYRYLPVIEKILIEEGVPSDFKYIAVVESNLTHAVSPAGATGFWQLLKETAIQYGLEVNDNVDERYHIEKSTRAACKFLKEAKNKFGSWTMAAAAYNMGMGGLNKQVERQKVGNYYDLLLNQETSRYLFRILAVKEILNQPDRYGFHLRKRDLYQRFVTKKVEVNGSIEDLVKFAQEHEINYKILKYYNPWLRDNSLKNVENKVYFIDIPVRKTMMNEADGTFPESHETDTIVSSEPVLE